MCAAAPAARARKCRRATIAKRCLPTDPMAPPHRGSLNSDPTLDAIAIELGAMQAIAEALAAVRDPQTRLRVLQWVNERFNHAPHATDSAEANEMLIGDDPALSVESLYALFERP